MTPSLFSVGWIFKNFKFSFFSFFKTQLPSQLRSRSKHSLAKKFCVYRRARLKHSFSFSVDAIGNLPRGETKNGLESSTILFKPQR